jgi:hypothetical protein
VRTSSNQAFVNQYIVYTLVTICLSGSIGLGTVWMRHQISLTANANRATEARIVEIQRHISEATTAIEGEQDANVLLRRNADWSLGLVPPSQGQVVHLTEDPAVHLATKRDRGLFGDAAVAISLPIALRR